jgi:hypothetical protein
MDVRDKVLKVHLHESIQAALHRTPDAVSPTTDLPWRHKQKCPCSRQAQCGVLASSDSWLCWDVGGQTRPQLLKPPQWSKWLSN